MIRSTVARHREIVGAPPLSTDISSHNGGSTLHTNAVRSAFRALLIASLGAAGSALAQSASNPPKPTQGTQHGSGGPAAQGAARAAETTTLQAVTVTGSRLITNGAESPTPLTMITLNDIQEEAPKDISDIVNQIPSVAGSATDESRAIQVSNGSAGVVAPALRGLGTDRTLILLNGDRVVQAQDTGEVDIDAFPQQLISRVDVVTGGASAVYGSDALSGVVNFVLDTTYTGLKGEVSGGRTTFGDDDNTKVDLTWGSGFADDRGHVLLSGEQYNNAGVLGNAAGTLYRPWQSGYPGEMPNPAFAVGNGQPLDLVGVPDIGSTIFIPGGIIISGPLKGIAFGPNGSPYPFVYGRVGGAPFTSMSGGNWQASDLSGMASLDPAVSRQNLFMRVSYDLTDSINAYLQVLRSATTETAWSIPEVSVLPLQGNNAYLPASVAAQAAAMGVSSFSLGDVISRLGSKVERDQDSVLLGADGTFQAFNTSWNWSAHASHGRTEDYEHVEGDYNTSNYSNAVNAVVNPANGEIVCASTLSNPNNGCVPFDVFGGTSTNPLYGNASQAAQNYVFGSAWRNEYFYLDDVDANIVGHPFSDWAGPIGLSFGTEYRNSRVNTNIDPGSAQKVWNVNFLNLFGDYHVTEGFMETEIPLARNVFMAKSLDLNGAFRETNYSTSGYVHTWKVGAVWSPIHDIRFRVTRSQDIRAPSLFELYSVGSPIIMTGGFIDPLCNCNSPPAKQNTIGNPNLKPEVGQTTDFGLVLQPRFIENLTVSVDYYDIRIADAIGSVPGQTEIDECYAGITTFCPAIVRTTVPGYATPQITSVNTEPFNFASEHAEGVDFEGDYSLPLGRLVKSWPGTLSFRALATHYIEDIQNEGIPGSLVVNLVGENTTPLNTPQAGGEPHWKFSSTLAYTNNQYVVAVTARGISAGTLNNADIVCQTSCPTVTASTVTPTVTANHIAGAFYLDAMFSYRFDVSGHPQLFFNVTNLVNRNPALLPGGSVYEPVSFGLYDLLGRVYDAGVRFNFD
jgi:iron complex outermembrane recepter protein